MCRYANHKQNRHPSVVAAVLVVVVAVVVQESRQKTGKNRRGWKGRRGTYQRT